MHEHSCLFHQSLKKLAVVERVVAAAVAEVTIVERFIEFLCMAV